MARMANLARWQHVESSGAHGRARQRVTVRGAWCPAPRGVPSPGDGRRLVRNAGYVNREAASFGGRVRGGSDNPRLSDSRACTPRDSRRSEEGPAGARRALAAAPVGGAVLGTAETRPPKPLRAALSATGKATVVSDAVERDAVRTPRCARRDARIARRGSSQSAAGKVPLTEIPR